MRVLVACEESQEVCKAFRALGHEAYSCDMLPCSGGHPEWHIQGDALEQLDKSWDLIIAHPPCTYLSNVATKYHSAKCTPLDKIAQRTMKRIEAMEFFMRFVNAPCAKIAIENPVGVMNTAFRKLDEVIHPYMFSGGGAEDVENYVTKATCLWLKGLSPLKPNSGVDKPNNADLFGRHPSGKAKTWEEVQVGGKDRAKVRSKTFPGIARAMAEQWGGVENDAGGNVQGAGPA